VNLAEYGPFIIPTINPSAVASSPRGKAYEQDIIEDFKLVRSHATGVFAEVDVPWGYNDNLTPEAVKPRMGAVDVKGQVWAYDIETNAKPVYDPAFRISMLAIDSDGDGKVAVFRGASVLAGIEALRIAHDGGAVVLGHNASGFDRPGIEARTGINLRNSDDTMLMAHLLDEESGKKLEDLVVRRIKVRPWKDEVTWTWAAGPQTQDEWERAGLYNARDARYTRMLYQNLDAELRADPALHAYYTKLFLPLSRAMSKVERNGVYLSLDQVGRAAGEFTVQRMKAEVRVRAIVGNEKFNPGSSKQVREVLFDRMNLPVQEWTDGGETGDPKESTNELSLKRLKYLVEQNPELPAEVPALVNALLDYRNGVKMLGMLEADVENVVNSPDGRVHYWYSMIGSVSRSSSNGQQRPRDPRMRAVISAPPGRALVQGDFSQMEMRIAAHLSQDANLLELYRTGGDIHRFTAANITGKAPELVTKEERDDAKPWNFSLLYGAEEYTVESIMLKDFDKIYPRSEVTRRRDAYHDQFIGLQKTWYPAVWAEARNTGQVRTLTGRVRRLPDIYSTDDRKRLEAYRQAINFTDQALGYDIAGIALILAVGMGMQVSWFLHDGIYVECAVDEIEQVKANFASIEAETPRLLKELFGVELSVPLPIDVTVKLG
jgi:DNA polymerase I-like protein with 3'-5' exonuclease and polymerase domains